MFGPGETSTRGGTGFGLAIVNSIAESHGWTVEITEGSAGGARFEIGDIGDDIDEVEDESIPRPSISGESDVPGPQVDND